MGLCASAAAALFEFFAAAARAWLVATYPGYADSLNVGCCFFLAQCFLPDGLNVVAHYGHLSGHGRHGLKHLIDVWAIALFGFFQQRIGTTPDV